MKSLKSLLTILLCICIISNAGCIYPAAKVVSTWAISARSASAQAASEPLTTDAPDAEASVNHPWHITDTGCPSLWTALASRDRQPGQDVVVAVIDTGLDTGCETFHDALWTNEAELNGNDGVDDDGNGYIDDIHGVNLANSYPRMTDSDGHGTEMASIIAGRPIAPSDDTSPIFCGIAYGAKIMPVKISTNTDFSSAKMIEGINYAVTMGADIINLSCVTFLEDSMLKDAIEEASQSCVIVASAGNQSIDASTGSKGLPAAWDFVIGVMSYDMDETLSSFSNFDCSETSCYELAAPGSHIWEVTKGGILKYGKGTSQSAAIVSGGVAILKSLTGDQYDAPGLGKLFLQYMDAGEKISFDSGDAIYSFSRFSLQPIKNDLDRLCAAGQSDTAVSSQPAITMAPSEIIDSPQPSITPVPTDMKTAAPSPEPVIPTTDTSSSAPAQDMTPTVTMLPVTPPVPTFPHNPSTSPTPYTSSAPAGTPSPAPHTSSVPQKTFTKGILKYQITGTHTVSVMGYAHPKKQTGKHLSIPDQVIYKKKAYRVTKIKRKAFINDQYLCTLRLGKNIAVIEKKAFKNCRQLKKIILKKRNTKLDPKKILRRLKKGKKTYISWSR